MLVAIDSQSFSLVSVRAGNGSMGRGSHIRWVNGSWVNSNDPLPALVSISLQLVFAAHILLRPIGITVTCSLKLTKCIDTILSLV